MKKKVMYVLLLLAISAPAMATGVAPHYASQIKVWGAVINVAMWGVGIRWF